MDRILIDKYFSFDHLKLAFERVRRWTDKESKDYFGLHSFSLNADEQLKLLQEKIVNQKYEPTNPAKYFSPKSTKMQRTRTILLIEDAIVYQE